MRLTRLPRPVLRPFVKTLWASDEGAAEGADRELVLPTGCMHVVFRLSAPLRLFEGAGDPVGRTLDHALAGGARAASYLRDVSRPVRSVGAQLEAGAAALLFGVPADELSGRHTSLRDLWGSAAVEAHERLLEADDPAERLDVFESLLAARLPRVQGLHPAVAHALSRFEASSGVGAVVEESGYSHRRFIELFRRSVGLTPKVYCRVLRFQEALHGMARGAAPADLALAAGYSDQPHLSREFRELAGIPPGKYRKLAPAFAHHVPLPR